MLNIVIKNLEDTKKLAKLVADSIEFSGRENDFYKIFG